MPEMDWKRLDTLFLSSVAALVADGQREDDAEETDELDLVFEEMDAEMAETFFDGLDISRLGEKDALELEARFRIFLNIVTLPLSLALGRIQQESGVEVAEWLHTYETERDRVNEHLAMREAQDDGPERDPGDN